MTISRLDNRRVYSALVFAPFFYLVVRYFPIAAFFALVLGASLLAGAEFYRLHFQDERNPLPMIIGLCATMLVLTSMQWPGLLSERSALLLTLISALSVPLMLRKDLNRSLVDSAVLALGALYIGLTMGCVLLIRSMQNGEMFIFFLVLITWAADTGAYFAGTKLGRHRLAPLISPNKTVEGLIGGLILAIMLALVARIWFIESFSITDCLVLGILLTIAGALGDLAESALKRSVGVKDSGSVIPGHGGMLDRLDSLLFTGPALYYYLTLVKG